MPTFEGTKVLVLVATKVVYWAETGVLGVVHWAETECWVKKFQPYLELEAQRFREYWEFWKRREGWDLGKREQLKGFEDWQLLAD